MRGWTTILVASLALLAGCRSSPPTVFRPPAGQYDTVRAAGAAAELGPPRSCLFRVAPFGVRTYGDHFVIDYALVTKHGQGDKVAELYKPLKDVSVFDSTGKPVAKEWENFDHPDAPVNAMVDYAIVSAQVVGRGDQYDLLVAEVPFGGRLPPGRVRITFDKPSYVLTTDGVSLEVAAQSVEVDQREGSYPVREKK